MKTLQLTTHTVTLYDSIEMPAEVDTKNNYYLLADAGIGSDMNAVDSHLSNLTALAYEGKAELLPQEVENLRLSIFSALTYYRPAHLAWACLIASIDGEPFTDLGEDNLKATIARLSADGLTARVIEELHEGIKKKYPPSWTSISPAADLTGNPYSLLEDSI